MNLRSFFCFLIAFSFVATIAYGSEWQTDYEQALATAKADKQMCLARLHWLRLVRAVHPDEKGCFLEGGLFELREEEPGPRRDRLSQAQSHFLRRSRNRTSVWRSNTTSTTADTQRWFCLVQTGKFWVNWKATATKDPPTSSRGWRNYVPSPESPVSCLRDHKGALFRRVMPDVLGSIASGYQLSPGSS